MRKAITSILVFVMCFTLCTSCESAAAAQNTLMPGSDGITSVVVSSMPEGYDYSFTGDQAETLAQYILDMEISADFPEDPNVYAGMTWVIVAEYENGNTATVYLFGNMFIRSGDGPWFKVSGKEAEGFEALLTSLS